MVPPNEANGSKLEHDTKQRQERITLRYPPQRPASISGDFDQKRDNEIQHTRSANDSDAQGLEHEDWFRAGVLLDQENQAERATPTLSPRRSDAARGRPRSVVLTSAGKSSADAVHGGRRRSFLVVVSAALLGSVLVIAAAVVSRWAKAGPQDTPTVTRAVTHVPTAALSVAPSTPASSSAVRLDSSLPTPAKSTSVQHPRRSTKHRTAPRTARPSTPAKNVDPGVPLNEVYVNTQGELVDPAGKRLQWHAAAPSAPGSNESAPPDEANAPAPSPSPTASELPRPPASSGDGHVL